MALSNGLKTLAALSARNIVIRDVSCPLCHLHPETTAHLLLECDYSFQVICKLIPQFTSFLFRPNLAQAFQFISGIDSTKKVKLGLLLILNVTEYFIWIERNSRKYNGRISCAITLAKKISSVVYLKLNSWKCGNSEVESSYGRIYLFFGFAGGILRCCSNLNYVAVLELFGIRFLGRQIFEPRTMMNPASPFGWSTGNQGA
ncbi:hypothetical protein MA16_Dca013324 [Dendrobium catenatum]|uniref:Reverse transcriptase zinc-binding domain-containing protein n=1 Tax=Dendrobium catenatum TaxID=906689 RepID=A0A2I0WDK9_9ASPA|nr:hypothetical protein MA16_Dca013324 [Dendrobium catenatum]